MSSRPGEGSLDSGTKATTATIPSRATGTPIRKTAPHQKCSSTAPPASGPPATAIPAVPAHTPMARPRSRGGNTLVMTARVVGWTAAPPMPMTARQPISSIGLSLNAANTEPSAKMLRPISRTRFRPMRSPITPQEKSSPANTRMYASTAHCSSPCVAPSSRCSVGMATLRMVFPVITTRRQTVMVASTHQRRA